MIPILQMSKVRLRKVVTCTRIQSWKVPKPRLMVTWLTKVHPCTGSKETEDYNQCGFFSLGKAGLLRACDWMLVFFSHCCQNAWNPLINHSFLWVFLFLPPPCKFSIRQGDPVQIPWIYKVKSADSFKTNSLGTRPRNLHFNILLLR